MASTTLQVLTNNEAACSTSNPTVRQVTAIRSGYATANAAQQGSSTISTA